MSYLVQPQDVSLLMAVLQNLDPDSANVIDTMNTLVDNQAQIIAAVTNSTEHNIGLVQDVRSLERRVINLE